MNYDRVHSLLSKASEAIISSDGRVKRRFSSYETVVGKHSDEQRFYIPDGAVNDNYGNLNYLASEIRNNNVKNRLSRLRYSMMASFAVVLILFAWSIYSFLIPTLSKPRGDQNGQAESELALQVHETQLERIANLIVTDNDWSDARITVFMKHWSASEDKGKANFKTTAWFQHFAYKLENKFNRALYTGELFADSNRQERSPLYTLALAIGVADPKIDYLAKIEKNKKYANAENAVTSELARMEQSRISGDNKSETVVADEKMLATILKDMNGDPLLPEKLAEAPSTSSETITKVQTLPVEVAAAASPQISEDDVSRVFQKYASAYERGNLKEMSALFGVDDPRQGQKMVEQLKENYETVFANSQKRSVNFKGINWRFDGNRATVNTDYLANIQLKNNKGTQTIKASAEIDIEKNKDRLKILNFELLNRSVSVVTPELNLPSANRNARELPETPTAAELQDIVTRLVSSYESGDIEMFSGLFAANAKTNDRQDLAGIKKDYSDLFKNSSDRQMFIQGMEWSYDGNYAKGTGKLAATVLSDRSGSVYSMGGKIQLVAQRIDGKVRITHMYHLERSK